MAKENKQTADQRISSGLTLLLATACGIIVANLYYARTPWQDPLVRQLGFHPAVLD